MTKSETGDYPDLKMVNPQAVAIDIGSTMHMAAVNPDANIMPVRRTPGCVSGSALSRPSSSKQRSGMVTLAHIKDNRVST